MYKAVTAYFMAESSKLIVYKAWIKFQHCGSTLKNDTLHFKH